MFDDVKQEVAAVTAAVVAVSADFGSGTGREMCKFDQDRVPRKLMKRGLALILIGHINFILGAVVHGSVLRHISKPSRHISTEYTVTNIISVTSGLLSISTGIIAILVSRNVHLLKMHIGLLVVSFLNTLLSAACCVGLLVAISMTVAHEGRGLLTGCNDTVDARSPFSAQCPFDTTRIYDTTLAIWVPCAGLAAAEVGLSVCCFLIGLALMRRDSCGSNSLKEQVGGSAQRQRLMGQRLDPDA